MDLRTRSGHNMYDMASMMQKSIRRGLVRYASYAAYELYGRYYNYVWKRLLVISAEDCYGIMTKEIIALKFADDEVNKGRKGYDRETVFLAKAVVLLCEARKNRDGCYVACNFMLPDSFLSQEEFDKIGYVTDEELNKMKMDESDFPDWVFDVHTLKGKYVFKKTELDMIIDEENGLNPHQYSMFDYGDWSEYFEHLEKNGKIDSKQINDAAEFSKKQKQKQIETNTEKYFERL